jgi:hypothetical protein
LEKERIISAIKSLEQSLHNLEEGNKLRALGLLTESRELIKEVRWLLKDQIKNEEKKIK